MSLPLLKDLGLLQTRWKSILDPIIAIPMLQGLQLTGIILNAATPTIIPTGLGRAQQGWIITDNLASCTIWRTQPFNSNNMTLESSADTTISIWVY